MAALLSLAVSPVPAAMAPDTAFAPAGQGRDYEAISRQNLTEKRPLGKLDLLLFAEGRPAREYAFFAEGALANYRAHEYANVLFKIMSNHILSGDARINPLEIREGPSSRHRFLRVQAGFQFKLPRHLDLETIGGKDLAGSPANTLEAHLTWWPVVYTYHPLGLGAGVSQDDMTHIQVYSFGATLGFAKALSMTWFLTASGQYFRGGALPKSEGRAAGGIGAGSRRGFGFKVAGGGGAHGPFADLAIFQKFSL